MVDDALNMLKKCSKQLIYYSNLELSLSIETIGYYENDQAYYERNNIPMWFEAAIKYINELEKIQIQSEDNSLKQTMDYIRITDDELDMSQYLETLSEEVECTIVPFKKEA